MDVWAKLWELSALIKEPIALIACALVAAMFFVLRKNAPNIAWAVLFSAIGVAALALLLQFGSAEPAFNVRVLVKNSKGQLINVGERNIDARIRNEKKPVRSEWQFDIAAADLPGTRTVQLWAQAPEQLLGQGTTNLKLDRFQHQVSTEIVLPDVERLPLRGIVLSRLGRAIKGARVSAPRAPDKVAVSNEDGGFTLECNAPDGDLIAVHTEANGFLPDNQSYTVSNRPITITLEPTHRAIRTR